MGSCCSPMSWMVACLVHITVWQPYQFFIVISAPCTPSILGFHRVRLHNLQIDWSFERISGWSSYCHAVYLYFVLTPPGASKGGSPVAPDLSNEPAAFQNLSEVFNKDKALLLFPHLPYDG